MRSHLRVTLGCWNGSPGHVHPTADKAHPATHFLKAPGHSLGPRAAERTEVFTSLADGHILFPCHTWGETEMVAVCLSHLWAPEVTPAVGLPRKVSG